MSFFDAVIASSIIDENAQRVPTFYATTTDPYHNFTPIGISSTAMGVLFGAIHCLGWSFDFPTRFESIAWRTSSLVVTCVPIVMMAIMTLSHIVSRSYFRDPNSQNSTLETVFSSFAAPIVAPIILLYVAARLVLIVLAITSLGGLPPDALRTIAWTRFIPHF
jgi:hypothetical protein